MTPSSRRRSRESLPACLPQGLRSSSEINSWLDIGLKFILFFLFFLFFIFPLRTTLLVWIRLEMMLFSLDKVFPVPCDQARATRSLQL